MKQFNPQDEHGNRLLSTIDLQNITETFAVDAKYDPTSPRAQAGTAVAEAVKDFVTLDQLASHADDKQVHLNGDEREKFNSLIDEKSGIEKQLENHIADDVKHVSPAEREQWNNTYQKEAVDHQMHMVDERLKNLEAVEVDQNFNPFSKNAQSGLSVAQATKPLAPIGMVEAHTRDRDIHVSTEDKIKWSDKYTIHDTDLKLEQLKESLNVDGKLAQLKDQLDIDGKLLKLKDSLNVDGKIDQLKESLNLDDKLQQLKESLDIDGKIAQLKESLNIDGRIAQLKEQLNIDGKMGQLKEYLNVDGKIDQLKDELDIDGRIDQLKSQLDIEGKLNALKVQLQQEAGIAYKDFATKESVAEHALNPSLHVTVQDKINWNDKYTIHEVDQKLNQLKHQVEKDAAINTDGFVTETELLEHTSNGDVHVSPAEKLNWSDKYSTREVDQKLRELTDRVASVEVMEVDQVYSPYSSHAQSGHAVASAIDGLITKDQFNKHANDTGIHVTKDEKETWSDKYTKKQVDDKLAEKLTASDLPDYEDRIKNVEDAVAGANIKNLEIESNLAGHISDTVVHITQEDRTRWNNALYAENVDHTFKPKSINPHSGLAVADAIKDLATKNALAEVEAAKADATDVKAIKDLIPNAATADNQLVDKAQMLDTIHKGHAHFRGSWETKAAIPSEATQYPQDVDGNHKPQKDDYLVVIKDETHDGHTWEYRYTGDWDTHGKDRWIGIYEISSSPLTSAQLAALDSGITKELVGQIGQKADQSDLDTLDGRVDALESKDWQVDQNYAPKSTNPQSGTAVAEAIKPLATKAEAATKTELAEVTGRLDTAEDAIEAEALKNLATEAELKEHKADNKVHVTKDLRDKLEEGYSKEELDTKLGEVGGRVDALEAKPDPVVDQSYNGESTNAQSGTAVAEAIKDLATKTELAEKADQSALQSLTDRVSEVESHPNITVDQTYDAESQNPQSGTAVAEAVKDLATKTELAEKADQSALQSLTERVETVEGVEVDQTYNGESTNAQSGTAVKEGLETVKVSITTDDGAAATFKSIKVYDATEAPELATREENVLYLEVGEEKPIVVDQTYNGESTNPQSGTAVAEAIEGLASKTEVQSLTERIETVEGATVDQTYDAESTNAQSGTAVAEAIKDLATKTEVAAKADTTTVTDLGDRVTALEEKPEATVDQTYNGESTNAQSGTAVAEAIKDFATKTEVAEKADQSALQSLTERVETVEAVTVDQTYSATSENAQSGKAVAEAVKDLASKTEMQAAIDAKVESVLHYKGQVATQGELPGADQVLGDVYNVEDTGANYAWNGTSWDKLSEDLSGFATKTELTTLSGRVETLEGVTVDQIYTAASSNAQSGKAVKGALDTVKVSIATDDGAAATFQSIKVYDATEAPELATREENVLYLEVGDEVPIVVDQTYNGTSTNPQSGKAVAEAVSGLAPASDLVKLTTHGGSTVTFKKILFYPNAADAPEIGSREEGVLYLIGE